MVERKVMDNFCSSLSDGTLAFQMQPLSELRAAALADETGAGGETRGEAGTRTGDA